MPVDLRGQPATSACSSAGEPTTSKPGRPRMCGPHSSPGLLPPAAGRNRSAGHACRRSSRCVRGRGFDSRRLHFFGRCANRGRDDAVGGLDLCPAVDLELGDEVPQEGFRLLRFVVGDELVEFDRRSRRVRRPWGACVPSSGVAAASSACWPRRSVRRLWRRERHSSQRSAESVPCSNAS